MPIYNSKDNDILAALEETYRAMLQEKLTPEEKAAKRAEREADGEEVEIKPEPPKPVYDAEPKKPKVLRTRNMRAGEGLGVRPIANRQQRNTGRGDEGQPDQGGRPMRG